INSSMRLRSSQIRVIILILIFYILPPIFIKLDFIPFNLRFVLLTAIAPLLFLIRPTKTTTRQQMGITTKGWFRSIASIIPVTLMIALPMFLLAMAHEPRYDNSSLTILFYGFYVLISCPFQEFAYRGFLFPALDVLDLNNWTRILFASVLYSFVHVIYKDAFILLFTFIMGILWNIFYEKNRNVIGVAFSHSILGTISILLGLI
ncbi:MAG: CPBP family intramembrane glutamic endopeptidase, partial [Cyanobacteria bacterium J06635_15]